MIHALVQITVEEFDRFWAGFTTRGLPLRQAHGSHGAQVFRHADDPNQVTIVFHWSSREDMVAFFQNPQVQDSQRRGGMLGQPVVTIVEQVGDLPA
jgi:heme-degrading monooxygenase HmoA